MSWSSRLKESSKLKLCTMRLTAAPSSFRPLFSSALFSCLPEGWSTRRPGQLPAVTLPIWPPKSPPRLIGRIACCSRTPAAAAWQRPSEESDAVCKLLMSPLVRDELRFARSTLDSNFQQKICFFCCFWQQLQSCTQTREAPGRSVSTAAVT